MMGIKKGVNTLRKERITLRKRGQFTLPKTILDELDLNEGDTLELRLEDDGRLSLVPMIEIPADQAWFWTKEWQEGEREADEDIKHGRVKSFDNVEDLIAELESDEIEEWAHEDK